MTAPEHMSARDKRAMIVLAWFVLGGGALFLAVLLGINTYVKRERESAAGPHERALVQAIATRDVAAAKAALAAGADLTAPIRVSEDAADMRNAVWLIVEEMAGMGGVQSARSRTDPALLDIARAIFGAGGNPNQSRGGGRRLSTGYLIETAVLADQPELIDIMVRAGLDVKGDGTGEALVQACDGQHDEVAMALVRAGANVSHRARGSGRTPLSEAVHHRRAALIDLFERAGALEWGAPAR